MTLISSVFTFLEQYGWHLTITLVAVYFAYSKFLAEPIKKYREQQAQKELERRRKEYNYDDAVARARERQQQEADEAIALAKEKAEEKRREKIEAANKKMEEQKLGEKEGFAANKGGRVEKMTKETIAEFIDRIVASKPVVVFSKTWCPYCRKAKSALSTYRLPGDFYEYIELDEEEELDGDAIQDEFLKRFGSRSVPKVFIGGKMIGGGDDTIALQRQGELDRLVAAAIEVFSERS